jgi:hypothetical protein
MRTMQHNTAALQQHTLHNTGLNTALCSSWTLHFAMAELRSAAVLSCAALLDTSTTFHTAASDTIRTQIGFFFFIGFISGPSALGPVRVRVFAY